MRAFFGKRGAIKRRFRCWPLFPSQVIKLIYGLYFLSFFVLFTGIVGFWISLSLEDHNRPWDSHFCYLQRTFLGGLFIISVGFLLIFMGFVNGAMMVWGVWLLWALIRLLKGFRLALKGKGIENERTYFW
jgi:uncharacterized membrane protein